MEKRSNSSVKRANGQLNFTFSEGFRAHYPSLSVYESLLSNPDSKEQYFITLENNHIIVFNNEEEVLRLRNSTHIKQVENILKRIKSSPKHLSNEKKKQSVESTLSRSFNLNNKLIAKIERTHIFQDKSAQNLNTRKEWPKKKKELENIIKNLSSIKLLPRLLLESNLFLGHISAQILIHKKGTTAVQSYYFNSNIGFNTYNLSTNDFNTFFSHVKKSKSKVFDKANIEIENLNVIGKFLAKEFELANHNILLVISRESFLAPTKSEIEYFDYTTSLLSPYFDSLLNKEAELLKNFFILQCLHSVPIPLAIYDSHQNCIFHNDQRTKLKDVIIEETYDLPRGKRLELYTMTNEKIASDIFHYKRISLLGELLNTLRHELSNPIFGIKLASDLLKEDLNTEEIVDTFKEISLSIDRCQNIMENFSNLYKEPEAYQTISIKDIISETLTLAKSEIKFIQKEVNLNLDEDQLKINTNPTWLFQILFNLIINGSQALKTLNRDAMENKIVITVNKDSENFYISIKDNGPGISDEMAENIFTPFYTTKEKGTGLGLAICRNLAEKLGGNISFHNNLENDGSTFTLSIPS